MKIKQSHNSKIYCVVAKHRYADGGINPFPAFFDTMPLTKEEAKREATRRNESDPEHDEYHFGIMLLKDAEKY